MEIVHPNPQISMYKIMRAYSFEAAHALPHLPPNHKCHHLHGHSYKLEVEVCGEANDSGWVMDFAEIDNLVVPLVNRLDHKNLNDLFSWPTTSELLAKWFYDELQIVSSVAISETAKSKAIYDGYARQS